MQVDYHGAMPRARTLFLAASLLLVVGVLAERLIVSDEERVEQAYAALVDAVENEQATQIASRITGGLKFAGPSPVNRGDADEALGRFEELFEAANGIKIIRRGKSEITVAPGFATMRVPQVVRFKYGDMFVAYKMDAVLTFDRVGPDWLLNQIEITSLTPGIM
jgi:hypothetical protein